MKDFELSGGAPISGRVFEFSKKGEGLFNVGLQKSVRRKEQDKMAEAAHRIIFLSLGTGVFRGILIAGCF